MFSRIEKQFKNTAPSPVTVTVVALVGQDSGIVAEVLAAGGSFPESDAARAEATRMWHWIRTNFPGQDVTFFQSHNGIVPAPPFVTPVGRMSFPELRKREPEVTVVNTINLDGATSAESAKRLAERIMRKNPELNPRPKPGHEYIHHAPRPGSYWQDRSRTVRFFAVVSTSECEGHTHVRMVRVDNQRGGTYDFVFTTPAKWDREWKQVLGSEVPGNPYAAAASVVYATKGKIEVSFGGAAPVPAADLSDAQIESIVKEHGHSVSGLREFLVDERARTKRKTAMPRELGMGYGEAARVPLSSLERRYRVVTPAESERIIEQYRNEHPNIVEFFREFIGGIPYSGNELPPAAGERYYSFISGQTYTVIASTPKFQSPHLDILMERDGDGHRTKFTFQDHATWLSVWRPLDDEEKPRKVVEVELKLDTKGATEALRNVGEQANAAAEAGRRFHEAFEAIDDAAVFDLVRLFDELHRRLPSWNEKPTTGPVLNETDLAIRAIRTLFRQRNNASEAYHDEKRKGERAGQLAKEHAAEQLRVTNRLQADIVRFKEGVKGWEQLDMAAKERAREMLLTWSRTFMAAHGRDILHQGLTRFNATNMTNLAPEVFIDFMNWCCAQVPAAH